MHYGLNATFFEPERQVARMEKLGIDRTVISLATPLVNYYLDPKLACEAARLCNDGFAELAVATRALWPGRFCPCRIRRRGRGVAALRPRARIRRRHVATNVRGTYLPDEAFRPIFEAASELDVPLFLHPVDPRPRPHRRLRAHRGGRLSVRFHHQRPAHDLQQLPRSLRRPQARLRPYRRVQPDAAQPHAARSRHQRGAVAHVAAQGRRLSAWPLLRHGLLRARLSALRRRNRPSGASAARKRRAVPARRGRSRQLRAQSLAGGAAAELALSANSSPPTGR